MIDQAQIFNDFEPSQIKNLMDFQPIRKESQVIYDDFSKLEEFYKLLMNLNHELQMSLKIKACTSARAR